jgi:DNA-binding response OmpR family regulator
MKILVVEDERQIASFLMKGLKAEGYAVQHVRTGSDAVGQVELTGVDLVLLDLGLPDIDGLEVLRRLRRHGDRTPVIILTARGAVDDRVAGLDLGADDYITKPFAFDELLARIRVRLRSPAVGPEGSLQVGPIQLDLRIRRVTVDGRETDLSAREFTLLETFLRHPGQVLTREQLLSRVWGLDFDPGSNLVNVYVSYLRRKLGPGRIETLRGRGYRLIRGPSPQKQAAATRAVRGSSARP